MNMKLKALMMTALTAAALFVGVGTAQAQGCPIGLTFDDGPSQHTPGIVDALNARGAKATFFMVGNMARANPGAAQHVAASGHQVANHSMGHDDLQGKSVAAAAADVHEANAVIAGITGVTPLVMRPPYGSTNDALVVAIGMPQIIWSDDPADYANRNSDTVFRLVTESAQCGDIVLLHDIHVTTAAAVPAILDNLQSRGFQMVTVQALIGTPPPGLYYRQ